MADPTLPIVDVRDVSKTYRAQGRSTEALRGANLTVKRGEFVCLLGASGCGKSTLLRIVAGFEAASGGEALMWGKPIDAPGPSRGMVFQDYGLFPWLSVRDNIGFGPRSRGRPAAEVRETTERYIDLVGLATFTEAYPHQLSGGMKQRVAIARVLANEAEVVLMDEPFGALDALTRRTLQDELLRIWSEYRKTIVFVTHSIEEAIYLADRILVMTYRPGRIKRDVAVPMPRPRDPASQDFNAIKRELGALVMEEQQRFTNAELHAPAVD